MMALDTNVVIAAINLRPAHVRARLDAEIAAGATVGARVAGPAVIREGLSTTFVCPGQVAIVGLHGELSVERA